MSLQFRADRVSSKARMTGQAMSEMVISLAVLVPLFLLIPIIAKYHHIHQAAQQAARNAVWEATATPGHAFTSSMRAQLQAKMLDRSFADADARIRTVTTGSQNGQFQDALLNTFSGQTLLEKRGTHVQRLSNGTSPGTLMGALSRINFPGPFPPNGRGYVSAGIQLNVRDLKLSNGQPARYLAPFDNMRMQVTKQQSLLVDAWNASGPTNGNRSVRAQVQGSLVPTSYLAPISRALDAFESIGNFIPVFRPLSDLDFGYVEPDVVPYDRLKNKPRNR